MRSEGSGIDPAAIDWSKVRNARYTMRETFRYRYPGPIRNLRHRLLVTPLDAYGGQRRISESLKVDPAVEVTRARDAFDNGVVRLFADRVERELTIELETTIEREPFDVRPVPAYLVTDPAFRRQSALTAPDAALLAAAKKIRSECSNDFEVAAAINIFVFKRMRYVPDVTSVATTAAEAFALGAGVCQDYAHIVLSLARACGLAARYVSGHLLGEGGTHAWVEILMPAQSGKSAATAWPFDPTHNRRESLDYIVVAVGRDYSDVAPTSGTYEAPYAGGLTVRKQLRLDSLELVS